MQQFMKTISRHIDALNAMMGRVTRWLVLVAVLISAGNALMRYLFDMSANSWLEIQWYLFAGIFMLGAGDALRQHDHIRIDILYDRYPAPWQRRITLLGTLFFLMPFAVLMVVLSVPVVWQSFVSGEMSPNAGGLVRWPVRLLVPAGFFLLALQGVSEVIKLSCPVITEDKGSAS